jgi:hypothetical protein
MYVNVRCRCLYTRKMAWKWRRNNANVHVQASFLIWQFWMVTGGGEGGGPMPSLTKTKEQMLRARMSTLLGSARIDSKKSISPAYVAWRAGTTTLFLLGSYSSRRLFKNFSTDVQHTFDSEEVALQYPFLASSLNSLVFITKLYFFRALFSGFHPKTVFSCLFVTTAHAGT